MGHTKRFCPFLFSLGHYCTVLVERAKVFWVTFSKATFLRLLFSAIAYKSRCLSPTRLYFVSKKTSRTQTIVLFLREPHFIYRSSSFIPAWKGYQKLFQTHTKRQIKGGVLLSVFLKTRFHKSRSNKYTHTYMCVYIL